MIAADLTDEFIGRHLWVQTAGSTDWRRVLFEGSTARPGSAERAAAAAVNGGEPFYMIIRCAPGDGVMTFRTPSGGLFTGILVKSTADVWPVDVIYAVSEDGEILEVGERAA